MLRDDNGAHAQFYFFEGRLKLGLALRFLLDRKLDDHDRVLGGQADDRDDANVEIDVGGQSPHHRKEDGAKYAERYNQKHGNRDGPALVRSEEHTSELQSLMRISYAVFCLKKKKTKKNKQHNRPSNNTTKQKK